MLDNIAPAFGFGFIAGVMPGPLQTFLLVQTLQRGARGGAWILPAPLISDGPIIVVCLLLLSQFNQGWLRGLSLLGGLFLIYLARESWRELKATQPTARDDAVADDEVRNIAAKYSGWALTGRAALINALGPGPWLFWGTVMGPLTIQLWRVSPGHGLAALGAFYSMLVGLLTVQLLVFSYARRLGPKFARAGTWLGIVLLIGFAVLLILFGVGAIDRYGL